ncbi:CpaF/VirB11 family protein [Nocardioides palaemonis]|uniref:CpaF/VirB11 family protein n=1 Tax=Nocardioides palaemonis TaxID=2829810 RepID=UPI002011256C|nr:CpaF/VirB11 family protein [Nocardioides palaemonis]
MESGTGSISTTHASDAVAAIRKLVTCAMEAGPHITQGLATGKLAATLDLVVHLDLDTTRPTTNHHRSSHGTPGRGAVPSRTRRVAEIVAIDPGERETGYATTHVFATGPDGTARPGVLPDAYRDLGGYGFDLSGYLAEQGVLS